MQAMNLLMRMAGRSENPRFKGENILQLELDMPERTTRDYEVLEHVPY